MPCTCGYIAVQMRLYECVNVTLIGVLYGGALLTIYRCKSDYMVLQMSLYECANVTRNGVLYDYTAGCL